MGKLSREKGKRFERWVVRWIDALGGKAKRLAPMQAGSPEDFADVRAELGDLVLEIECSHGKAPPVWRKLEQMEAQRRDPGALGICILKRDGEKPIAVLRLDTMGDILVRCGRAK